jgi:hypothetical protein
MTRTKIIKDEKGKKIGWAVYPTKRRVLFRVFWCPRHKTKSSTMVPKRNKTALEVMGLIGDPTPDCCVLGCNRKARYLEDFPKEAL